MPTATDERRRVALARPSFRVRDQDEPALTDGLLELVIRHDAAGLQSCEAAFGNWGPKEGAIGFLYFDRQQLDFGHAFEVLVGDEPLFTGNVTGLEARFPEGEAPQLCVLAEDRLQELRITRRTRTFVNQSDADLFRTIAGDHGLEAEIDLAGPTHRLLAQLNRSDLAFLRDRARVLGADLWIEGGKLHAATRADAGDPPKLTLGGDLREFTVIADLAHQRTSVEVGGWDAAGKSAARHTADESVVQSELADGEGGASLLKSAFGDRKESIVRTLARTTEEARAEAEAAFRQRARRFVTGHGVATTSAQIVVGRAVELAGLGPLFEGRYWITETIVRFDGDGGLRTEFKAERAALGRAS